MQRSITEDVVIPEGSEIKPNLNDHTLTNKEGHTITNYGTLIIMDSVENGTFTRSDEKSTSSMAGGENSCSVLVNHGDMHIYDDAAVTIEGMVSPLILNGWKTSGESSADSSPDSSTDKKAILNIEGGLFSGGKENIDNRYYGYVYIYGGTFQEGASDSILNYNVLQIENGRFSTKSEKKRYGIKQF
ncbi:MAG: hypothetical protein MST07_08955 [Firmicutes bacterium]|nr:hypothetical protein [Bacillota bacterium]